MEETFNAVEVFKIAEQIERDGEQFYRAVAAKFENTDIQELFCKLAEWELEHERTFAAMRVDIEKDNPTVKVTDPEKCQAMSALSEFVIKSDTSKILTDLMTIKSSIEMAIGMEKDSVIFYTGLKDFVTDKTAIEKIDDIIAQEHSHIEILKSKL